LGLQVNLQVKWMHNHEFEEDFFYFGKGQR
jgi:hypothetical protein